MSDFLAPLHLYTQRRVLILGAAGFLGRWVARALSSHEADLYLVVRNESTARAIFSTWDIRGQVIPQDLEDLEAVRWLIETIQPSFIFNLAGYGVDPTERSADRAEHINVHLVREIVDTVANLRPVVEPFPRIVHVGSALEYGAIGGDLAEDSVPNPTTLYGRTKLAGTKILSERCLQKGVQGLTARLFMVYGPGEHKSRLLPSLLETARSGSPIALTTGEQQRDFTFVEDVAEGLLRLGCVPAPPGTIVNLATGRLTRVREFIETAAQLLNLAGEQLQFGALPTRAEEMAHAPVAVAKLRELLGWIPATTIREGILRTRSFLARPLAAKVETPPRVG